jgi:hypothetical protein
MQNAEHDERVMTIVAAALRLRVEEREAYIRGASGNDTGLLNEVKEAMEWEQQLGGFLQQPVFVLEGSPGPFEPNSKASIPATVGRYRVVGVLGEGGMGIVYEAEQDQPRRRVALKVIKPGLATSERLWRFAHESKALGRLQHPGIAQIYEASTADTGSGEQPYFAMEFIRGQSLLTYAQENRLNTRQRLELVAKICDAVQHAHQRGLIHRDLKPGNILVDRSGQPKILDFGVARVTESDLNPTLETSFGQIVGTLAYMSPEQVRADPQEVDTRSDVYSLGVILYELLSGRLPHVVGRNQIHEALQLIREAEPTPLSSIDRSCRGDIETIVNKALEKDKTRRYASALDLSSDIQRYLRDEPIAARPPSATYQMGKFIRRHRALVAGVAAIFVVLMGGIVASMSQARRANRAGGLALMQRDRAETEARTSAEVQRFIEDIFETNSSDQTDPIKARQTTARQLLDIGARKIDSELDGAPAAKERMLAILAKLYLGLGLDDQAVDLYRKRVAVAKAFHGANDPNVAAALCDLGASMHASRAVNERESVLLEAKAILDRDRDFNSTTRGELLMALAEHYQSVDARKALDFAGQGVSLYRRIPASSDLAAALYLQGTIFDASGDYAKGAPLLDEAVAVSRKVNGDPNPSLPLYAAVLGEADSELMRYGAAKENFELGLRSAKLLNGEEHEDTIESEARLGGFLSEISEYKEALRHLKHALDVCLKIKGPGDPFFTPQVLLLYGQTLWASGQPEAGLAAISAAVENRRKNRPGTRYLGQMLSEQASLLADLGQYEKARKSLEEADAITKKVGFRPMPEYAAARLKLAFASKRPDEASATIENFYGPLSDHAPLSFNLLRNLLERADLALFSHDPASALRLATRASDAVTSSAVRPFLRYWEARAALAEGNSCLQQQLPSEALPRLKRAVQLGSDMYEASSAERLPALAALATAYLQLGDRPAASQLLANAESIRKLHRHLGERYDGALRLLRQSEQQQR